MVGRRTIFERVVAASVSIAITKLLSILSSSTGSFFR
jgi:hypothetical protein